MFLLISKALQNLKHLQAGYLSVCLVGTLSSESRAKPVLGQYLLH